MVEAELTGYTLDDVQVSTSDDFHHPHPDAVLPKLLWLKINGTVKADDFALSENWNSWFLTVPLRYYVKAE